MQSEAVLVGLLLADRYAVWALLAVATTGNVLGSVLNWLLGPPIERYRHKRWLPVREGQLAQAQQAYPRLRRLSLLPSLVPIIGDPHTTLAGVTWNTLLHFLLYVILAKTPPYPAPTSTHLV